MCLLTVHLVGGFEFPGRIGAGGAPGPVGTDGTRHTETPGRQRQGQQIVSKYQIGVIGGDGIGPEVTSEALKVVRAAGCRKWDCSALIVVDSLALRKALGMREDQKYITRWSTQARFREPHGEKATPFLVFTQQLTMRRGRGHSALEKQALELGNRLRAYQDLRAGLRLVVPLPEAEGSQWALLNYLIRAPLNDRPTPAAVCGRSRKVPDGPRGLSGEIARRLSHGCALFHRRRTAARAAARRVSGPAEDRSQGGVHPLGALPLRLDLHARRLPGRADQPGHALDAVRGPRRWCRSWSTAAKLVPCKQTSPAEEAPSTECLVDRLKVHHLKQHLLVTNRGPANDGYDYCTKCGRIEPSVLPTSQLGAAHKKPYPDERHPNCEGATTRGIVLGTDFITDILLISLTVEEPILLSPSFLATDIALRTVSEAISKAACLLLELEPSELQAEYRPALTALGKAGKQIEIYVYDTLPGGAGFARQIGARGLEVLQKALAILEGCPDKCDRSCYRCLRSYKNKFEHDLLDRKVGAVLLNYLLKWRTAPLGARADRSFTRSSIQRFEEAIGRGSLNPQASTNTDSRNWDN